MDAGTRNTLSVAFRNTHRMKNMLEELVMMSKIEMSHLEVTVRQGDVLEFVDRICDIFRIFAGETGVDFFVGIDNREGRKVWFSPTNIERIIYNLLSNAFKFTPDSGMIHIKAWLSDDGPGGECMLNIQVKDTGCGIEPQLQEKIFENYYTTAEQGKHKGAGIGLALTNSLTKLHKGSISVESAVGEGAVFKVRINVDREAYDEKEIGQVPVETAPKSTQEYIDGNNGYLRQARIEIQNHSPKRSRILVVEDNRELNEFISQIFSDNFEILTAYDGAEGYETAIREVPDIVISDIVMPESDGLEMTRRLKSDMLTSHIPVVLLTARSEENDKIEGFEGGADAYIEKPFNPQRLELQVNNLLNTRRRNIERFKHEVSFDARKLTRNPRDEKFLSSMVEVIMKNLGNDNFAVKDITDAMCISRSLLHIKLKNLTDLSVTELIRNIRMKEARKMLIQGKNVSETSFMVGISDPNYFSKCFKKQFGQTPSDFLRALKNNH
jgi:CheY-like chemotaxis protein/anti-sigma regulatory factor (Ser/Thr protein kinase)